jgi:signal transduction histidine kinase
MGLLSHVYRIAAGAPIGYVAAVVVPTALSYWVTWLRLPPFVFEHLVVLLVLGVAIPWGLGPAIVAALVSVVSHHVLLPDPFGESTITGYRDVIDLAMFAAVAIIVSGLVRQAHTARIGAHAAAARERRAREERDRLIATVTHDLATPLAVLSGTVQFFRRHGINADDLPRLLKRLETASARATSLVRTLSDAQALDADLFGLEVSLHDMRALVGPIVDMMDRFSERHPVILAAPETPVWVKVDADRLQRVVENLVNNAIKYSPEGGPVEVSIVVEDGRAVLHVRDHGIGIPPDALPRIFERSYRAPDAAAHAPGLGLGLSIAAQVVARHGGTIEAHPGDAGGTIFSVRLPLAPRHETNEEPLSVAGSGRRTFPAAGSR